MGCKIGKIETIYSILNFVFKLITKGLFRVRCLGGNNGPWLLLNGNPETSITICWVTKNKKKSALYWGNSKSNLTHIENSQKSRNHSVTINNLLSGTLYYYRIDEELELYGEGWTFSFTTVKKSDSKKQVEFIIAGDLQPNSEYTLQTNRIIAEQIDRENPDFIVQTGDLVHVGNSVKAWNCLLQTLPVLASERPVLSAIGNHEYYPFHRNNNFRSYFPYNFQDRKGCYYSVDIGSIHFAYLDPYDGGFSGMDSKITDKQKRWFIHDLEKAVEKRSSWFFVILHHPVFTSGEHPNDLELRKWIVPVLSDFDVDAVFWGHAHYYEHWRYKYGENGLLMSSGDKPGQNHIEYFCIGSSGVDLESNYTLFTHKPYRCKGLSWYNIEKGLSEKNTFVQYTWNKDKFFSGKMGVDQFNESELHYYHMPFDKNGEYSTDPRVSYFTDNKRFGYKYGENTMHYAKLKVEENICKISIHYADGSILSGPEGNLPQVFKLYKKDRSHLKFLNT